MATAGTPADAGCAQRASVCLACAATHLLSLSLSGRRRLLVQILLRMCAYISAQSVRVCLLRVGAGRRIPAWHALCGPAQPERPLPTQISSQTSSQIVCMYRLVCQAQTPCRLYKERGELGWLDTATLATAARTTCRPKHPAISLCMLKQEAWGGAGTRRRLCVGGMGTTLAAAACE